MGSGIRGVGTVLSDFDGVRVARFSSRISLMVSGMKLYLDGTLQKTSLLQGVTINVANVQICESRAIPLFVYDGSCLREREREPVRRSP